MQGPQSACCPTMREQLALACPSHGDTDCPDVLLSYSSRFDEYGLRIHDGGSSSVVISFCPWCGTRLPSRRDEWFRRLEELGIEDPDDPAVPVEFRSGDWYLGS